MNQKNTPLDLAAKVCRIHDKLKEGMVHGTSTRSCALASKEAMSALSEVMGRHVLELDDARGLVTVVAAIGGAGYVRVGNRQAALEDALVYLGVLCESLVKKSLGGVDTDANSILTYLIRNNMILEGRTG